MLRRLAVSLSAVICLLFAPLAIVDASAGETDCKSSAYACTPGYTGQNASGTWSWKYYGGSWSTTPTGHHNCTLYVAWRLGQNGLADPGRSWGNAKDWAANLGGGNKVPAVGAVAWWGASRGGGYGHVAYVEQVSGSSVYVVADNYSSSGGYTTAGWIAASSVEQFLHPRDLTPASTANYADGTFVNVQENGQVYRIAGGAPIYVSTWSAFGGGQPTTSISLAQLNSMRQFPIDGTFIVGAQRGEVYRVVGGAPTYVSTWSAFGGPQPTTTVDIAAIDNAGAGSVWNHLLYTPADGTFVVGAQRGEVYRMAGGAPVYVSTWSAFGGPQPTTTVDIAAIDNAGAGSVWKHMRYTPADGTYVVGAQTGKVYHVSGGTALYVSSWTQVGGQKPTVPTDQVAIDNAGRGGVWNHLTGVGSL